VGYVMVMMMAITPSLNASNLLLPIQASLLAGERRRQELFPLLHCLEKFPYPFRVLSEVTHADAGFGPDINPTP